MSDKIELEFAKHRTNGFILDMIIQSLDSEIGVSSQKNYQRLIDEENISPNEYDELLEIVIEDLVHVFIDSKDSENTRYFKALIKEFLEFYNTYKCDIETLGATQRQLDFIVTATLFVPFVSSAVLTETCRLTKSLFLIDRILPDNSTSALQKALMIIESDLKQEYRESDYKSNLKKLLFEIFDSEGNDKDTPNQDDTINKNINNWLSNKHIPTITSIKSIAKLAGYCQNWSEKGIYNLLVVAKIIQNLYDKSCKYFGYKESDLLVEHFRLVSVWNCVVQTEGINNAIKKIKNNCSLESKRALNEYLQFYLTNLYTWIHDNMEHHTFTYNNIVKLKVWGQPIMAMLIFTESFFFKYIQYFLPTSYFALENAEVPITDSQSHMKQSMERIFKPKETLGLDIKSIYPILDSVNNFLSIGRELDNVEIINEMLVSDKNLNCLNQEYYFFINCYNLLFVYTDPEQPKAQDKEMEQEFLSILENVEQQYITESNPYIAFVKARFYAQKRDFKEATKYYVQSLKYGKNVMGGNIRDVIKEGLIVSAQVATKDQVDLINAKSDFTKFYKEAFFYKLIDNLPHEISQHFLTDRKKQFDIYFTHCFDSKEEVQSDILRDKKRLKQKKKEKKIHILSPNFGTYLIEDLESIKIDFTKPDKWIKDVYMDPVTQLMHCCNQGQIENVQKLLENGADVNVQRPKDNTTALILCTPSLYNSAMFYPSTNTNCKNAYPKNVKRSNQCKIGKRKRDCIIVCYCIWACRDCRIAYQTWGRFRI